LDAGRETEIHRQFDELVHVYSGLALSQDAPGRWVVRGDLHFSATFEAVTIEDTFVILLLLPRDYPSSPPMIQETGGRIPRDFHTDPNGNLCLGAPVAVRARFLQNPRLLPFVNDLVVSFLFSFCYFQEHGRMPFGELSHGGKGILEYYQDLFHVKDHLATLGLLKILADDSYRGHFACPCGSGANLRRCHGPQLRGLMPVQSNERFLQDIKAVLCSLSEENIKKLNKNMLPKELLRRLETFSPTNDRSKAKYI
jgi:hypothetical protein